MGLRLAGAKAAAPPDRSGDDAEHLHFRVGDVEAGQFAEDGQDPREEDAPEDVAADFLDHEDGREDDAEHGQEDRNADGVEGPRSSGLFEREQGNLGCRIGDDDLGVQQADEGDEQADAGRDGFLQGNRDGVEDGFADIGQGQDDEIRPSKKTAARAISQV